MHGPDTIPGDRTLFVKRPDTLPQDRTLLTWPDTFRPLDRTLSPTLLYIRFLSIFSYRTRTNTEHHFFVKYRTRTNTEHENFWNIEHERTPNMKIFKISNTNEHRTRRTPVFFHPWFAVFVNFITVSVPRSDMACSISPYKHIICCIWNCGSVLPKCLKIKN